MRILRLAYRHKECWGLLEAGLVKVLKYPPFSRIVFNGDKIPFGKIELLPPVYPSKVVLAGLNYIDHAREMKMHLPEEPLIFLKPPTSVIASGGDIIYPDFATRVEYEAELAVVIKKEAKTIREDEVNEYILGYTCLNDVTERDLQKKDGQWTRAKSFDTFCPIGPWVETEIDPSNLAIKAYLNGQLRQDSSTSNFIFPVNRLVSFISQVMTLLPGDVISTGTPAGVGQMHPEDIIEVEISGIGKLTNTVKKACSA